METNSTASLTAAAVPIRLPLVILLMLLPLMVPAESHSDPDLTPEILADLYFLRAEEYIKATNYGAANETLAKIFVLNEQNSLTNEFHYKYARVLFMLKNYEAAISSLELYLKKSGQSGTHYEAALRLLHNVLLSRDEAARDEAAYRTARENGTAEALHEYLSKFPDGVYVDTALQLLREMETKAAAVRDAQAYKDAIDKGTVEALRQYVSEFPDGIHADNAHRSVKDLEAKAANDQDRKAYNDAVLVGTNNALRKYLKDYPDGIHADEATVAAEYLRPGRSFRDCDHCPEMVVVKAGSYMMGSPTEEKGHSSYEEPLHQVTIDHPIAVGVYEVKLSEYQVFAKQENAESARCWTSVDGEWEDSATHDWENPGYEQTDEYPVVCVNWNDTQLYVNWLCRQTEKEYRLLSEAEWEYVARAGTDTPFHYGETISDRQANYSGEYAMPVGTYEENDFGLYDVHGNVWEWVQDCWRDNYHDAPSDGTSWESGGCSSRLLRGGAWNVELAESLRSSTRGRNDVDLRGSFNGFRVAYTLDDVAQLRPAKVKDVLRVEPMTETCAGQ